MRPLEPANSRICAGVFFGIKSSFAVLALPLFGILTVPQALAGFSDPNIVLIALFLITALTALFISNTATAGLMAPGALGVAAALGVSPQPLVMPVAIACSAVFSSPLSAPLNALILQPGGYRFSDFVKVGVPFTLLVMVVTVLPVPILLPL